MEDYKSGDTVILEDYWAKRHDRKCVIVAKHVFGPLWVVVPFDDQRESEQFLVSHNNFTKE